MLSIVLIGIGLSMDAFAVSLSNCLTVKDFNWRLALRMGLYFGGFQFLMPLIGAYLGSTVSDYVSAYGPYISFLLLGFIGGKMLFESLKGSEDDFCAVPVLSHPRLLALAVATSLDALAAGVSFAFMDVALVFSCALIGIITFVICVFGSLLGSKIPGITGRKAGILGGLVLVGIGLKLLLEGVL